MSAFGAEGLILRAERISTLAISGRFGTRSEEVAQATGSKVLGQPVAWWPMAEESFASVLLADCAIVASGRPQVATGESHKPAPPAGARQSPIVCVYVCIWMALAHPDTLIEKEEAAAAKHIMHQSSPSALGPNERGRHGEALEEPQA